MVRPTPASSCSNDRRRIVQVCAAVGLQAIQPNHHGGQSPKLSDATALPVCGSVHDDARQERFERFVGADRYRRFRAATARRHGRGRWRATIGHAYLTWRAGLERGFERAKRFS